MRALRKFVGIAGLACATVGFACGDTERVSGGTTGNDSGAGGTGDAGVGGGVVPGGGDTGIGGSGGETNDTGGSGAGATQEGRSCSGMTGEECAGESCCLSILVPGSTFPMGRGTETCSGCTEGCPSGVNCSTYEQPEHSATVGSFVLDKYEVTVGRFRAFVEAGKGTQLSPPAADSGAHPANDASGWFSAWNNLLASDEIALRDALKCGSPNYTWTDARGDHETYPIACVTWYEAFAFCIWDGGRLPTEAEWECAAAGGEENRVYPWGNDVAEPLPALFERYDFPVLNVGSQPPGDARWGHSDLAGSIAEWVLDLFASDWYETTQTGCADCANLAAGSNRGIRGGSWNSGSPRPLRGAYRQGSDPAYRYVTAGVRCVRDTR